MDGNLDWITKNNPKEWLILYTFVGLKFLKNKKIYRTMMTNIYSERKCLINPDLFCGEGVILFRNPFDAELYFENDNNLERMKIAENVYVFTLLQVRVKPKALR